MIKKYSLLFFFLCCISFGFGQTKEIDSLKNVLLNQDLSDTTKVSATLNLAIAFYPFSLDSLKYYSEKAMELSKSSNDYFLERTYNNLSVYYLDIGQMDSSRYYSKKIIEQSKIMKDTTMLILAYGNYASTLGDDTQFEESVRLYLKAIELAKNNKKQLGQLQYNVALKYEDSNYDSLANKYLKLATKNGEESNYDLLLSNTLPNLAYYAIENNQLDLAKSYLDRSLLVCKKLKSSRAWSTYYLRLGLYYDNIEMFDKAEIAFDKALYEAEQANYTYNRMFAYISLGEHFVMTRTLRDAIKNLENFEKMHKIYPNAGMAVKAYEVRAKAENMIGNFKKANEYLERYVKLNDSLNSDKNKTALANAETKYQSEKKDKEIAEQKLALTQSKSKTRTMSILIVSLLFASILLWFLFQQRQKRIQQQLVTIQREQEVRTLESLMEGEEKERFRIAKELHDGVNGDLSAIKFKLSSLLEMNNTVIKEAVDMIDNSCEQVRAISHNLVPPSLKDFNLVEAVEEYCQSMNSIHEPEIHFQQMGNAISLDKKQEANVFRIVQELVTNSIKHAEAKEINVQLSHLENTLQLTVEDDGKGYDPKTVKSDGIGMHNVQSRVDYLNATIDFLSNEKGTSYTIVMDTKTI